MDHLLPVEQNPIDLNLAVWCNGAMVTPEIRQARNALHAKRKSLKDELKSVELAIDALDRILSSTPAVPRAARTGTIKEAIASVMRESGEVLHADDIVQAVKARGIELSARDPKGTVVTALIRLRQAQQVQSLGRNRWKWAGGKQE